MKALILAAGRGKRLSAHTNGGSKCMLSLFGKPLLEYSLENATRAGVSEIVLVVGYRAVEIIDTFDGQYMGVPISYAFQREPRGLVHAMECGRPALQGSDFMLFLGDEILVEPLHQRMLERFQEERLFAVCGVVRTPNLDEVRKTYSVVQGDDGLITRLIEKPSVPPNNIRGTGNCIFRGNIFDYCALTPVNPVRGEKELPDLIQCAIDDGRPVGSFELASGYVNLNTADDVQSVEKLYGTAPSAFSNLTAV